MYLRGATNIKAEVIKEIAEVSDRHCQIALKVQQRKGMKSKGFEAGMAENADVVQRRKEAEAWTTGPGPRGLRNDEHDEEAAGATAAQGDLQTTGRTLADSKQRPGATQGTCIQVAADREATTAARKKGTSPHRLRLRHCRFSTDEVDTMASLWDSPLFAALPSPHE